MAELEPNESAGRQDQPKVAETPTRSLPWRRLITGARADRRRDPPFIMLRLVLLGLSSAGTCAAALLWAFGHGHLALRVLSGDILVMLFILLTF